MRSFNRFALSVRTARIALVGICAVLPAFARAETTTEIGNTLPADLKPIELRFRNPGIIKKVNVKEGDPIKVGQVLFEQDDREEQDELKILEGDATDIRVQGAKVSKEAKQLELDRVQRIHDTGAQNDLELDKAKAEVEIAKLTITQEQQDLIVKQLKVQKQKNIIERMQLKSLIDGLVQTVDSRAGELVDPSKPAVVTVVRNDPLVVEVVLPTAATQKLKLDRALRVSYDRKDWKEAKVSYLAPMAAVGSGVQTVHLSLPNPDHRDSGLQIYVELPDDLTQAIKTAEADRISGDGRVVAHQQ